MTSKEKYSNQPCHLLCVAFLFYLYIWKPFACWPFTTNRLPALYIYKTPKPNPKPNPLLRLALPPTTPTASSRKLHVLDPLRAGERRDGARRPPHPR